MDSRETDLYPQTEWETTPARTSILVVESDA